MSLKKKIIIGVITVLFVFFIGWLSKDKYYLGSITLCFGMVQVTLMMKGSWVAELLALFETLVSVAIYVFNGLYGTVIFCALVYIPMGIYSIFSWKNNQQDGVVKMNKFTMKASLIVTGSLLVFTLVLAGLLSLIPSQNLSFLDSLTNGLNIAGVILIAKRYKEGWYFWMLCNVIESITWIIMIINAAPNSIMMLIICIVYLILDFFGIKAFAKIRTEQEKTVIIRNN